MKIVCSLEIVYLLYSAVQINTDRLSMGAQGRGEEKERQCRQGTKFYFSSIFKPMMTPFLSLLPLLLFSSSGR